MDDKINSGNFSVRVYLPFLTRKDSSTHIHCLVVYVKEGLPFASWNLSLENSVDSYVFNWLYFTQCLISISSIYHLLGLYAQYNLS